MKKFIIIWYLDDNGDTRLQLLDVGEVDVQTFLQEYSKRSGVKTIVEAYTVIEMHEIAENAWTEGFTVNTVDLSEWERQ
jgi:hypothetical protein